MRDAGRILPSSVRSARRLAPDVAILAMVSALALAAAAPTFAQPATGTAAFAVRVTDEDGAPISGARVLAQPSEAGSVAAPPAVETDELGQAVVGGLTDGEWFVEVSHPAYMLFAAYLELRGGKKPQVGFSSQVNTETSWKPMRVKFFKASPTARRGASTRQRAEPAPPEVVRETVEKPVEQPEPPKVVRPEPAPDSAETPSAVTETEAQSTPAEPREERVEADSPREVPAAVSTATTEPSPAEERQEPSSAPATEPVSEMPAAEMPAPEVPAPEVPAPGPPVSEVAESEAPTPEVTPMAEPTVAQPAEPAVERPVEQPAEPTRTEAARTEPPTRRAPEIEAEPQAPTRPAAPEVPSSTEPAVAPPTIEAEPVTTESPSEEIARAESAPPSEAVEEPTPEPTEEAAPTAAEPIAAPSPTPKETAAGTEASSVAVEEPEPESETGDRSPPPAPAVTAPEPPSTPPAVAPSLPRFLRSAAAGTCPECEPGEWAVAAEQEAARAGESRAAQQCSEAFVEGAARAVRLLADADAPRLESYAGPLLTAMWRLEPTGRDAVEELLAPRTDPSSHCQLAGVVLPAGAQFSGYVIEAWDVLGGRTCLAGFDCAVGQSRWLGEPEVVVGEERTVVYGIFKNRSTRRERRARMTIYFRPPSETWRPATR